MSEFEKIVNVSPAYDKRSSDPSKNYGVGACLIWFILKGPKGAVQFQIGTNWYPPHVQQEFENRPKSQYFRVQPEGWDVGYHSPVPMYEGQSPMEGCALVDNCHYDGLSLRAQEWIPSFIEGGTEWLWTKLEAVYRERFEGVADTSPL